MNTIHRTVWNRALGAWVAAPETARSHRKGGVRAKRLAVPAAVAALLWMGAMPGWAAGGEGGQTAQTYYAGSGGSAGNGGKGGWNDDQTNTGGGDGGSATAVGVTNGAAGSAPGGAGGLAGTGAGGNGQNGVDELTGYAGGGGAGNHGASVLNAAGADLQTPATGGSGGAGGTGYWAAGGGGAGGIGAVVTISSTPGVAPVVNVQSVVTGGAGGKGGDTVSQAGGGGSGGVGLWVGFDSTPGTLTNSGTLQGGAGGAGGSELPGALRYNASGGGGGEGGAGAVVNGVATVTNSGTIAGGAGGDGGVGGGQGGSGGTPAIGLPGAGGDGGTGLLIQANAGTTVINNTGSITGGAGGIGATSSRGGPAADNGAGGAGLVGANLQVNNAGTIAGGQAGGGGAIAAAVQFTGGTNSLTLQGNAVTGRVEVGTGATATIESQASGREVAGLVLGGATALSATSGNSLVVTDTVSGAAGLTVSGAGTVTLSTANTYSGGTSVNGGNLRIASSQALGSGATSIDNGSLTAAGDATVANLTLAGTSRLAAAAGKTLTVAGSDLAAGGNIVAGSATDTGIVDAQGPGSFADSSSTLRVAGGTLKGAAAGVWSANFASTTVDSGATLDYGSGAGSIRNLQGAGKVQAGTQLVVNEGSFGGEIAGNAALVKNGTGTLALSGNSSYTGGTELKQGRLDLGSNTALGGGELAMDDGTTLGFAADGLNVANNIRMTGTNDPVIDTGSFSESLAGTISGGGALTKQGSGTLTLSGPNNYVGATNVAAGTLRAGAAGTFSAASVHNVAAGATLDLAGFSQTVAGVSNAGTVSLMGSTPGTTLTVTGPWVGNNGTLRMGTALGGSASVSDRLVLSGASASASGTTNVQITNLGGLGALTTGNGIEVVSAINGATTTAQTSKDAFVLAGGHVDAGAYEYRLRAADASGAGENWYLSSTAAPAPAPAPPPAPGPAPSPSSQAPSGTVAAVPTYRVEVPLYSALPGQFREAGLAMLGNLHQRVGDEANSNAAGQRQAWGRIISMNRDISQSGTVSPNSEGRLDGFQAGTDLWASPAWRTGVYVGQLDGDMDVDGFARGVQGYASGSNDLRAQFVGAYATWNNGAGLYVDSVLQGGRLSYDVNPSAGAASSHGKGNSVVGSVEIGQAFAVSPGWVVEPQLQVVGQHVSLDDVNISGARIQQDADDAWLLRLGVRVRGDLPTSQGLVQPYARVNLYTGKGGTDIARFIGPAAFTDIAAATGGTRAELAVGASWHVSPTVSLYGEVGNLWDIGGSVRTDGGINGSVGVKLRW